MSKRIESPTAELQNNKLKRLLASIDGMDGIEKPMPKSKESAFDYDVKVYYDPEKDNATVYLRIEQYPNVRFRLGYKDVSKRPCQYQSYCFEMESEQYVKNIWVKMTSGLNQDSNLLYPEDPWMVDIDLGREVSDRVILDTVSETGLVATTSNVDVGDYIDLCEIPRPARQI